LTGHNQLVTPERKRNAGTEFSFAPCALRDLWRLGSSTLLPADAGVIGNIPVGDREDSFGG